MTSPAERGLSPEQWELFELLLAEEGLASGWQAIHLRSEVGDPPLSFAQMRLWLFEQMSPGSATYNLPAGLRLRGALDPAILACCDEISRRHESLRSTFRMHGGEPVQVIARPGPVALPIVDLENLAGYRAEAEAKRIAREEARRPFDLERGPLLRLVLLRFAKQEHQLILNLHHIVADGWSIDILVRELGELYVAFAAGRPSPLDELPIQYADFAAWQKREQETLFREPLAYWRRQLADLPAALELPTDRPRPPVPSHRGASVMRAFPAALRFQVMDHAERHGASPFMVLLAGLFALARRYTGQDDLAVGSPTANRNRMETERLIGFFVNTLVMRVRLAGDPTFAELRERVRGVAFDAYAHEGLPFEKLVEELEPVRSAAISPLYQVVFVMQNAARRRLELPALEIVSMDLETGTAKFDWTLAVHEEGEALAARLEYATDLFDETTIFRMLEHYVRLLTGALADDRRRISELPLLSMEEARQILEDWRGGRRRFPPHHCLHEAFAARAAERPDAPALTWEGMWVTYAELERRANQLARYLRSLGIRPEERVALLLERAPDLIVAILGVLKAGGAYVPLDPSNPEDRVAYILDDAGVRVLLSEARLAGSLGRWPGAVIRLDSEAIVLARQSVEPLPPCTSPGSLAYIIYTSGSTGRPKGCLVEHGNVLRLFAATEDWFGFGPDDVWTLFHSPAFDFSVWEIWGALLYGGRLAMVPYWVTRTPEAFLALLRREGVTILNQTPSAFRQLVHADAEVEEANGLALRRIIFGGEALEIQALEPWFRRHGDAQPLLVNMYGITETTVHVTFRPVGSADLRRACGSPLGIPIPDLELYLLDDYLQPVPLGVIGEIYVGGAGVARGYTHRPDLTAARFVPDPFSGRPDARLYRSGDLARRLGDGELDYLGRGDDQVKVRGFRIEPGEVATALSSHPGVAECVVVVREDVSGDRRLVAYWVAAPGTAPSTGELHAWMKRIVPEYMLPAAYVPLARLPLTAQGKLDRRALPAPEVEPVRTDAARTGRSPLEDVLAEIWGELLGMHPAMIGPQDDFFGLGGHSLLVTQLLSRLRRSLGIEIPVRLLFEAATLRELAGQAQRQLRGGGDLSEVPLEKVPRGEGGLPLSFIQERLWFLHQIEPEGSAFNLTTALRLHGPVDVASLRESLREVVHRHEVLRTIYDDSSGAVRQVVLPVAAAQAPVVDLSALDGAHRICELSRLAVEEERHPFNLRRNPPFRGCLFRLGIDDHAVLVTVHHIASDGWSQGVLLREIGASYEARSSGLPSPLLELPLQYADYAVWQRRCQTEGHLREQLDYWRRHLAGPLPALALPCKRSRGVRRRFQGRRQSLEISAALARELRDLSRREGVTLFMTLLAGFQLLLYLSTAQEDLLVGSAIANRNRVELERLIGSFSNLLALRTDLSGDPSVRELLGRVRDTCLGAYAHQDLPFEVLLESIQEQPWASGAPLFQVAFLLQNAPLPRPEIRGLQISHLESQRRTVNFDLTLFLAEGEHGAIMGSLEYDDALFEDEMIAGLRESYTSLLAEVVHDLERPLSRFSLPEPGGPSIVDVFNEAL